MRKLWLIFTQTATITLAVLLVVMTFRPDLLPWRSNNGNMVTIKETATPDSPQKSAPYSFRSAAQKAMPSVVNIFTSKEVQLPRNPLMDDPVFRHFFGGRAGPQTQRVSSLGSGVIVSPQGYILTNHHVVEAADEIEVALADGRTASARIVGSDPDTDLAVVKVELKNLPAVTFGNSDKAQVGDVVLAIGNPFGVGQTVTMGIISALGRSHLGINTFENFIQTDAPINPGNSGGALVDVSGNLIGVNSAIFSKSGGSQGIGFAIPTSLAKQIMEQIIQHGSVLRGWIGVEVQDITPELAESFNLQNPGGVIIAGVLRNGPADHANIRPGDILMSINGKGLDNSSAMLGQIAGLTPDTTATLKILRKHQEMTLPVKIGKRPRMQQQEGE